MPSAMMGAKEMVTNCWTRISVPLLCVLTGTALGATPAQKCAATKTKAAGAKVYAKAKRYQKALANGSTVDSTCLTKAEQKFVAAFGKAESDDEDSRAGGSSGARAAGCRQAPNAEPRLSIALLSTRTN
jgi:hypothetical protein